jgi:hypothetical protein
VINLSSHGHRGNIEKLYRVIDAVVSERIVGLLQGTDIQLAVQGVTMLKAVRQREP